MKLSEDHKKKIGISNKGKKRSEKFKQHLSEIQKGKPLTKKHKKAIGNGLKKAYEKGRRVPVNQSGCSNPFYGKAHSEDARHKMALAKIGKKASNETKRKMSLSHAGSKHPNWKGGVSNEPYCDVWVDKEFKEDLKERDNHECQNPFCWGTSTRLCGHHIDYDKKNCTPLNIITLCISCNSRANKNREYWKELYIKILNERDIL